MPPVLAFKIFMVSYVLQPSYRSSALNALFSPQCFFQPSMLFFSLQCPLQPSNSLALFLEGLFLSDEGLEMIFSLSRNYGIRKTV
jgi:hypothetical protein